MKKSIILLLLMATICGISACGKEKVKTSSSEYSSSSSAINENSSSIVEKTEAFYSLQNAYDNGYITYEDLLNIAYHSGNAGHNPDIFQDFTPKTIGEMGTGTATSLKTELVKRHNEEVENYKATVDDFVIAGYYGCYNGLYAFIAENVNADGPAVIVEEWETIEGVRFRYTDSDRIELWRNVQEKESGTFCSLQEAYDNGWLNQEQLLSIAYHYQGSSLNEELMGENYTPISKTPETLSDETVQKILNDYMIMKKSEDKAYSDLVIEDVKLIAYLGMYGDFVAVKMDVITTGHTGLVMNEEVAGICYYNGEGGANPIMVYKKG